MGVYTKYCNSEIGRYKRVLHKQNSFIFIVIYINFGLLEWFYSTFIRIGVTVIYIFTLKKSNSVVYMSTRVLTPARLINMCAGLVLEFSPFDLILPFCILNFFIEY